MFKDPDTVSDYKESQDITVLPVQIIPLWRSSMLTALVREIDLATIQLAAREKKTAIVRWISRSGERHVTDDEKPYQRIPLGLHLKAYGQDFLEKISILVHHQLKICKDNQPYSLADVLGYLKKITRSAS
ncbi:hypothetical protein PGT21_016746 [Puccinia graminis f. sp. tritici]|uniref:Uncharacterized protein n=1 Tax=Puccinia graminis f. sp. tritici TaxID=56615 RepID=A0A5B0M3G8_PUCGR|nr:hypothetical protein PGT21_016746 [Puccinia graminis f. sp. tritici]KAA1125962.1 hypothetical protein PGTUg99_025512 [Puccinia graminis f. sp. tritici]